MKKEIRFWIGLIFVKFFGGVVNYIKKENRVWIGRIFVTFCGVFLNYITKDGYVVCCCYILLIDIAKEQWLKKD